MPADRSDRGDHPATQPRRVLVSFARVDGWMDRYDVRHPGTSWAYAAESIEATSPDGSSAVLTVPFGPLRRTERLGWLDHLTLRRHLGVLLVRRGGFAVAHVQGDRVVESKIGRRHVQGRTKAGGWSQQRFARRRDNQAREAYEAAADHAARLLLPPAERLDAMVLGGDTAGVRKVLEDRRLARLRDLPERWLHGVADPKRDELEAAVEQACAVEVTVVDTTR